MDRVLHFVLALAVVAVLALLVVRLQHLLPGHSGLHLLPGRMGNGRTVQ